MPYADVEYQAEYQRQRYLKLKKQRIELALERLGGLCVDCSSDQNLQFDHKDPGTKLFNVPTGTQRTLNAFLAEVDKCELRCRNCHRARTRKTNGWLQVGSLEGRIHGLISTYNNGCRCDECRKANANTEYLRRNKN